MVINYLDRQSFAVATPKIASEFDLSNQDIAFINNSFTTAYAVGQLLAGRLMDVVGTRAGFVLIMAFWSAAGILCSFSSGVRSLSFFRFLLGCGEAGGIPVGVKAVSEWFPKAERSLGVAYFSSGSGIGAALAPPLIAQLIILSGWRSAFVVIGSIGFLWIIVWLWFYQSPSRHPRISQQELALIATDTTAVRQQKAQPGLGAMLREWTGLLGYRQIRGLFMLRVFSDSVLYFYIQWLPKYFADERGYSILDIRDRLWMVFVPGFFAGLACGAAAGRLIDRGWSVDRARKIVMLAAGLPMVASVGVGLVDSDVAALALSTIALVAFYGYSVNMLTLPADLVPPRLVASVSGLSGMGAGLGSIVFTFVVGRLADEYSFTPVFILVGLLPLIALAILFFATGKVERVIAD